MFASRFIFGSLASAVCLFMIESSSQAFLANAVGKQNPHLESLHKAAQELKHATAAVNGKNGGNAGQHVTAAIGHIEKAIEHHKKSQAEQNNSGIGGLVQKTANQKHHSHLHEALSAAKAAEKHLSGNNAGQAGKEIAKAHHHVEEAIKSHSGLK